jgi:hypothetical protein
MCIDQLSFPDAFPRQEEVLMAVNPYPSDLVSRFEQLRLSGRFHIHRGWVFGALITTALLAFEIFNYGTTDYALTDLLGDLEFVGVRWATILAIAFCGIDFAGIARLFTPEDGQAHNENWFLFGAWLLAATMNATLTWWGVSLAILNHQAAGEAVIGRETMLRVGPVFVAVLVWLIRVLIIGAFSIAGERLFILNDEQLRRIYLSQAQRAPMYPSASKTPTYASRQPIGAIKASTPAASMRGSIERAPLSRPTPTPARQAQRLSLAEPLDDDEMHLEEPAYSPLPLAARQTHRTANSALAINDPSPTHTSFSRQRR